MLLLGLWMLLWIIYLWSPCAKPVPPVHQDGRISVSAYAVLCFVGALRVSICFQSCFLLVFLDTARCGLFAFHPFAALLAFPRHFSFAVTDDNAALDRQLDGGCAKSDDHFSGGGHCSRSDADFRLEQRLGKVPAIVPEDSPGARSNR